VKRTILILGLIAYILGVSVGSGLALLATWADLEAQFYGFYRRANASLRGVSCPALMSPTEQAQVTLRLTNPTSRALSPVVRAEISTPLLPEVSLNRVDLGPGESATLTWTIGRQNIDLERFIFVSVLVYASYPLPDRQIMCGVLIVPSPLPGRLLTPLAVLVSLVGMGIGLFVPWRQRVSWSAWRTMPALAVVVAGAMAFSLAGAWGMGILLLILIGLLILITLGLILVADLRAEAEVG